MFTNFHIYRELELLAVGLVLILQLLFTYWPVMQQLFGTVALDTTAWRHSVVIGLLLFLLIELEKHLLRRRNNDHQ